MVTYIENRGFRLQVHWLDNKASIFLKTFNHDNDIEFQLVPLQMRRNAAERAIGTW